MRILMWEQHFLGAGHLFRMAQIARVLAERHEVHLLIGGCEPSFEVVSERVIKVPLPVVAPRKHADKTYIERETSYDSLAAVDGGPALPILERRRAQILELVEALRPAVLVTEYFPLGRRLFALELMPAIERMRSWGGRVVCSVRDVLQGDVARRLAAMPAGAEQERTLRFHRDAVTDLNTWFDLLLVHGDEGFLSLRQTLPPWMPAAIQVPIHYTGYVARTVGPSDAGLRSDRLPDRLPDRLEARLNAGQGHVVVSVGSGGSGGQQRFSHGAGAIGPSVAAWQALAAADEIDGRTMVIFLGATTPEQEFRALVDACPQPWFIVHRASPDFVYWLHHADLSISRAGYNTCAEVMACATPSILLPSRKNTDQEARAQALARHGLAIVLQEDELTAESLRRAILDGLRLKPPARPAALEGAAVAARLIEAVGAVAP